MTTMALGIRKLERSDCEAYRALRLQALQESSRSFSDSYEDELQKPPDYFRGLMGEGPEHFTVGCFSSADLVAIATYKRDQRRKARHKSFIHTMYVAPEFRGQKIGRNLLGTLIQEARALPGVEQIHLWVLSPETSPARKLYLSAGFRPQGAVVKDDLLIEGRYVDAEYLTLVLA
jgi:GNAT superfamily N-acetyltransferase